MTETVSPHKQPDADSPHSASRKRAIYLAGAAAASIAALFPLLSQRSEPGSALFFGYSAPRLAMIAIVALSLIFTVAAAIFMRKARNIRHDLLRTCPRLTKILRELTTLFFLLTAVILIIFLYWLPDAAPAITRRFLPLGLWFAFLCLWSTLFLRLPNPLHLDRDRLRFALAGFAFIVLLSALGLPAFLRTRFGFKPDPFDYQPPGIALDWGQVGSALLAAAIFGWLFSLLTRAVSRSNRVSAFERMLIFAAFLLIWGVAGFVWISVPTDEVLRHSYFMEIAEPGGLPYPASDAAYFAVWAESMQMGLGMKNAVISRQLFVWLLSVLFRFGKGDFYRTVDLLTGILALIPSSGFLLTLQLTPRRRAGFFAGAFVSALLIFREWKTLYMAPHFGVSSAKMFLSDLPMLLMFLAVMNTAVWAYRKTVSSAQIRSCCPLYSAIVGAIFGLAVLVRSQVLVILPVLLLAILIRRGMRAKIIAMLSLCGALILVLAPSLIRSRVVTGAFALEDTSIHGYELTRRYSGDPNYEPTRIEGESADDFADRMSAELIQFAADRPTETATFILNHWTKALTEAALVLPLGIDRTLTWRERTDPGYQDIARRMSEVPAGVFYPLIGLACLGIAASWKRGGWMIGFSCALYLFSSALGRYSGWRFNLPADWFIVLYVGLGVSAIAEFLRALVSEPEGSDDNSESSLLSSSAHTPTHPNRRTIGVVFALVCAVIIGAQPALSDWLIADRIRPSVENEADARAFLAEAKISESEYAELEILLLETKEFCSGVVLYPRYFYANEGLTSANPWAAYRPRDFDRLSFVLLNRRNCDVVLPVGIADAIIPHHAECLIGGKRNASGVLIGNFAVCREMEPVITGKND